MTVNATSKYSASLGLELKLKSVSKIIGWSLVVLSVVNLSGWSLGINWMQAPFLGIASMKVSAAVCFLLAGITLSLQQSGNELFRRLSHLSTLLLFLVVLSIYASYFCGLDFIPLHVLSPTAQPNYTTLPPQLISPAVATIFLIAALGFIGTNFGKQDIPSLLAISFGSLAFFSRLLGIHTFHETYGFGFTRFSGIETYISFLASFMLAAMGFGMLFSDPKRALYGLLCSTSGGGFFIRRLLPLSLGLPLFLAAVTAGGEHAHLYNHSVRWSLFVNSVIVIFGWLTCVIANRLDAIDRSRMLLAEKRADIVYSLAHDLKVPLIGSTQAIDLLLKEALGKVEAQQRNVLVVLRDSLSDELWMIENLVYEYQSEQGHESITLHPCLMPRLLDDCLDKMMPAFQSKGIEVVVKHESPDETLSADSLAIRRVINNLLHNALKHTPRDGEIRITSRVEGTNFSFAIWNSGPIISEANKLRLFERFWQSEEGRNRQAGNGLGLYICRQIVTAHGGSIICDGEAVEGTSFSVTIPFPGRNRSQSAVTEPEV